MIRRFLLSAAGTVMAGLATLAITAGSAAAGTVTINFVELPNDGGIQLGGLDISSNVINVTKLNSEVFHISSPAVPFGYSPDAILSHIGISHTSAGYLVNILESAGGPISDQVFVHQFVPGYTVIDFISEPASFFGGTPDATVVETGSLQNVLNYTNDRGELVSVNVQSPVPEPGTLALFGAGLLGTLAAFRRRRLS